MADYRVAIAIALWAVGAFASLQKQILDLERGQLVVVPTWRQCSVSCDRTGVIGGKERYLLEVHFVGEVENNDSRPYLYRGSGGTTTCATPSMVPSYHHNQPIGHSLPRTPIVRKPGCD